MTLKKTYRIVEFDANDCPEVIESGLSRNDARKRLEHWRKNAKELGASFRYIMRREIPESYNLQTGNYLWTGNLRTEPQTIKCPNCGADVLDEWTASGMRRCVWCHTLFEREEN